MAGWHLRDLGRPAGPMAIALLLQRMTWHVSALFLPNSSLLRACLSPLQSNEPLSSRVFPKAPQELLRMDFWAGAQREGEKESLSRAVLFNRNLM